MTPDLDHELSSSLPFGHTDSIFSRRASFYRVVLSAGLPSLRGALDSVWPHFSSQPDEAVGPIMRDSVFRSYLHDLLNGADPECERVLLETLEELTRQPYDWRSVAERHLSRHVLVPGTRSTLWTEPTRSPFTGRLIQLFEAECLPNRLTGTVSTGELIAADIDLQRLVAEGMQILFSYLPRTTSSALRHTSIAAWARVGTDAARMQSGATRTIPGMIFLSVDELTSPWSVAEALLHESVHQKLFDLYITNNILGPGYDALLAPRITVPWNIDHDMQSNQWPVDQALAALHVYAHLAALGALAREKEPGAASLHERALYRGGFLADALSNTVDKSLALGGRVLVTWCADVLARATEQSNRQRFPTTAVFERFGEHERAAGLAWSPVLGRPLLTGDRMTRLLMGESADGPSPLLERAGELGLIQDGR